MTIMLLLTFIIISLLFIICACSSAPAKTPKKGAGAENGHVSEKDKQWSFTYPDMPVTLADNAEEKIKYLSLHFWDNYDFTDTVAISRPEYAEQTLVDYLFILARNEDERVVGNSLRRLANDMRKDSTVYAWFDEKLEHYLYDPNSRMRNDEYYLAVLQGILESDNYQEVEKIRPAFRMKMLKKNRQGSMAENFTYSLEGGKKGSLYGIKSLYTLLLLYDPECENCHHAIDMLVQSSVIRRLTTETEGMNRTPVKILTVCVERDIDSWERHLSMLPEYWLNGFDGQQQIRDKELYDLRSFPSLYLLDNDKRVLLKDVDVQDVINYFTTLNMKGYEL